MPEAGEPRQGSPFRFVDRLLEREPFKRCVTCKRFSAGESLLRGSEEIPFSLVMEALCQSAAFLAGEDGPAGGRIVRIDHAQRLAAVKVGEELRITSTLLEAGAGAMRAESIGTVEGRSVARLVVLVGV
jgi:3-hydroxymyristoyl/3-hydroxydecanoyl-(acyl carrier protein) dehydratase